MACGAPTPPLRRATRRCKSAQPARRSSFGGPKGGTTSCACHRGKRWSSATSTLPRRSCRSRRRPSTTCNARWASASTWRAPFRGTARRVRRSRSQRATPSPRLTPRASRSSTWPRWRASTRCSASSSPLTASGTFDARLRHGGGRGKHARAALVHAPHCQNRAGGEGSRRWRRVPSADQQ